MLKLIIIKFHYYSVTKPKINLCSKDQMLCKIATPLSSTKQPICLSNHPLNNSSNDHIIVTRHDNVCIHICVYICIYYTHTAQPRRNPKAREKEKKKNKVLVPSCLTASFAVNILTTSTLFPNPLCKH